MSIVTTKRGNGRYGSKQLLLTRCCLFGDAGLVLMAIYVLDLSLIITVYSFHVECTAVETIYPGKTMICQYVLVNIAIRISCCSNRAWERNNRTQDLNT